MCLGDALNKWLFLFCENTSQFCCGFFFKPLHNCTSMSQLSELNHYLEMSKVFTNTQISNYLETYILQRFSETYLRTCSWLTWFSRMMSLFDNWTEMFGSGLSKGYILMTWLTSWHQLVLPTKTKGTQWKRRLLLRDCLIARKLKKYQN